MRHPRNCSESGPLDAPFESFLDSKAATGSGSDRSGTYTTQLERVVGSWIEEMRKRNVRTFADLDTHALAQWVEEYLAQRVRAHRSADVDGGISAASANTYYDYVSAYLEYCRRWGIIEDNPAATAVARDPLPKRPSRQASDQQFWSPIQRRAIVTHVRRQATEARESDESPLTELRNLALVVTIGYSGVRGAELLRLPRGADDRRTGATWGDLDFEAMTLQVLGKDQDREQVPLTDRPLPALAEFRESLAPGSEEWPLFPTFHRPTLYARLRERLESAGYNEDTIEAEIDAARTPLALYREHDWSPPALTTEGARHVLKRLTESAGIDVDGEKSYLTLHGARRGVGEQYYREESPAAAQRVLRHADPRTTSEMYAHIEASELSELGSGVFEDR